jgi:TetR/AcrR family fatty acid metabolism transcriptional regulator
MPTKSVPDGQPARTFIEEARRAQIVAGAIETIAEVGYGQASLARIAQRLGISKGVIGYHFAGKDELLAEVAREVLAKATEYVQPRLAEARTGSEWLATYIEANAGFMAAYRSHMVAIVEIARNSREQSAASFDPTVLRRAAEALAGALAGFQEKAELSANFDPMVMAVAIRAAIDAIPQRLTRDPELDVEHWGRELAALFAAATRPVKAGRSPRKR